MHLVDRCLLTSQAWSTAVDALREPSHLTINGAMRVARTIADLDEAEYVSADHLAEALTFLPAHLPEATTGRDQE